MGKIVSKCPTTGKLFPVGIAVANADALKSMTLSGNRTQCPHCGQMHVWGNENVSYQD